MRPGQILANRGSRAINNPPPHTPIGSCAFVWISQGHSFHTHITNHSMLAANQRKIQFSVHFEPKSKSYPFSFLTYSVLHDHTPLAAGKKSTAFYARSWLAERDPFVKTGKCPYNCPSLLAYRGIVAPFRSSYFMLYFSSMKWSKTMQEVSAKDIKMSTPKGNENETLLFRECRETTLYWGYRFVSLSA